jgi:hypothetical protein
MPTTHARGEKNLGVTASCPPTVNRYAGRWRTRIPYHAVPLLRRYRVAAA